MGAAVSCIFCKIVAHQADASVVFEDDLFIAFLDIYPVRPGHMLVVPKEHAVRLGDMQPWLAGQLFACGQRLGKALRESGLPCEDINFVLNDGPVANQTVGHVHLHLVPRTRGDLKSIGRKILQRPIQPLLGAEKRPVLEDQARRISAALA
jgi:diadenosine tetraphosphate (Ap4A) HIT family hydrolase